MSLSSICFIAIVFFVASMVVQNFGELLVMRRHRGEIEELTCVSENDDSALIWNRGNGIKKEFAKYVQPKKPKPNNVTECAVWNTIRCRAHWKDISGWKVVKSANNPMGPVFDFRWEGFQEYSSDQDINKSKYQDLGKGNQSPLSVVFSVRGGNDAHFHLCENADLIKGHCFWITIGASGRVKIIIKYCDKGGRPDADSASGIECSEIVQNEHKDESILNANEWHTFGLIWTSYKIRVVRFIGYEKRLIFKGRSKRCSNLSQILVKLDNTTRVRFHFYEYLLTEKSGSVLYTEEFDHSEEDFCVELLVGLCPECKLVVNLVNTNNSNFEIGNITGNEKSVDQRTTIWQSVKLSKNFENDGHKFGKSSKLKIRAILTESRGNGWWAIDNFRMCKPAGQRRKSTIFLPSNQSDVKCQKLSYDGSTVVDPWSLNNINGDRIESGKFNDKLIESCGYPCRNFGKNSLLCNSMGCTCDRGYKGSNCDKTCTDGYHGYNCDEICTPCIIGFCNKITGRCATGCPRNTLLPPDCRKEIKKPIVMDITNTTAIVYQNIEFEADIRFSVDVVIRVKSFETCMNFTANLGDPGRPFYYESYLSNLSLDTIYTVHTIVSVKSADDIISVTSPKTNFTTTCFMLKDFMITQGKNELNISSKTKGVCVYKKYPHYRVRIFRAAHIQIEGVLSYEDLPASYDKLTPYTEYRVMISDITNHKVWFDEKIRTLESAPPQVKELKLYEADIDTNTIYLEWIPPNPAYGEIESYQVKITQGEKVISNKNFNVSEKGLECELRKDYVCLKNLKFPKRITKNNTYDIEIWAINRGIEEPGNVTIVHITSEIYEQEPSEPKNLTSIPQSHGIMMLNWSRHTISLTKITKFHIKVHQVSTQLNTSRMNRIPIMVVRPDQPYQIQYSAKLFLFPSTVYNVSIVAVNKRNVMSEESVIQITVPESVAFASHGKLQVTRKGTLINVEVPAVVNATRDTRVNVTVKGLATCSKIDSTTASSSIELTEWVADVYEVGIIRDKPEENKTKNLTIGANYDHAVPFHCSLYIRKIYEIKLVATDSSSDPMSASITLKIDDDHFQVDLRSNQSWLVSPPILAICVVLLLIGYRNRERVWGRLEEPIYVDPDSLSTTTISKRPSSPIYLEIIPPSPPEKSRHDTMDLNSRESLVSQLEIVENEHDLYSLPNEPDSCSVVIENFEEYVKDAAASGLLDSQFMLLPKDLTRPYEYGSLPENMPKNRCKYQIAYDHSRVVLKKIPGDPYSDYINASYIKGYRKNKAYIAAEGPKPNTVNDFWRMVWQEKVRVICMLTDVTKDAETECEKYWPDVGTMVVQGNFHISNIDEQVSANYTLRIFELSHGQNTRQVTHLHYTEWPTLGVPIYPQSLVEYLKKLRQTRAKDGPILVHCSTGDDRTGTVILCDICLRQAITRKVTDVTAVIKRMRNSRANMVGTLQQYVLAHIIITESIVSWSTQIPTDVLLAGIKDLRIRLPHDIQRLNDSKWQEEALKSAATRNLPTAQEEANAKIPDLEPDIPEVIYVNVADKHRDHINAVSVDSFKMNEQYLACSLPPPLTLASFWGFIVERDIKLIIIMQCSDPKYPTCIDIMPYESIVIPMLEIQVEDETSLDEREYFTYEKLLLGDTSQDKARSQSVAVLTCKGWGCGRNQKPPPPATLISLWRAAEEIPRKKGETLVLCDDGITGCGLYLALSFLLEQMAVEKVCNVISAVQSVRRSEWGFVQSLEQFDYLYDAAVNYSERFLTYANLC